MAQHPFATNLRSTRGDIELDLVGGPRERYQVIYADPPWRFTNYSAKGEDRNATSWYDCMSIEDMARLPVADLAAPDCALFMWVTDPTLRDAFKLLDALGFTYSSVAFDWIKLNKTVGQRRDINLDRDVFMGLGYMTRSNPERVFIATRGEPAVLPGVLSSDGTDVSEAYSVLLAKRGSPQRMSRSVRQTVFASVGLHSEKPPVFRDAIVQLIKADRRIELFSRRDPDPEWDVWGNQVGALEAGTIQKRRPAPSATPLLDAA